MAIIKESSSLPQGIFNGLPLDVHPRVAKEISTIMASLSVWVNLKGRINKNLPAVLKYY